MLATALAIAVPALAVLLAGRRLGDFGAKVPDRSTALLTAGLLLASLPISFLAAGLPDVRAFYLLYALGPAAAVVRALDMFAIEWLFRGPLLFGLGRRFGRWAILLQAIPYVLIHIGKPVLEIPYSFGAGLIFGALNYRSGSVLPSFILHAAGSEIFLWLVYSLA